MSTFPRTHVAGYEGRPLPRPEEDVVDQGLGFDVVTLMGRRRLLRALGLGAIGIGLTACGTSPSTGSPSTGSPSTGSPSTGSAAPSSSGSATAETATGEIPDETAGPYPGDGSNGPDVLNRSGIVRSDIRSSFGGADGTAEGVPMTLELTVTDIADGGAPFADAAVYVWHCDREGGYSLYSDGITDQNYLRGVQIADADGVVSFTSIVPACYPGRWPHIHFEVYAKEADITDAANAIATSQVALPEAVCTEVYASPGYEASAHTLAQVSLESDNVFGDDSGASQLATVAGDVTNGYTVALAVRVDTTTTPTGGQLNGDGAPSGAPGGEPPAGPRRGGTPATGPR